MKLILIVLFSTLLASCGENPKKTAKSLGKQGTESQKNAETPKQHGQTVTVSCQCWPSFIGGLGYYYEIKGTGASKEVAEKNAEKICKDEIYKDSKSAFITQCNTIRGE